MNESLIRARRILSQEGHYSRPECDTGSVVPTPLFVTKANDEAVDPIKRVMLAMLNHAVCCYQEVLHEQNTTHLQAFLQAEEWLLGAPSCEPFSFEDVCSTLNTSPDSCRDMPDSCCTQHCRSSGKSR